MRVPVAASALVVLALMAFAGPSTASPLDVQDLAGAVDPAALLPDASAPLSAPPLEASPATFAGTADAPEVTGPADIVAPAAAAVASGQAQPAQLALLAAQQHLVASLEPNLAPAWRLQRSLPALPIPAASVAAPDVLDLPIGAPARAAVVAVSALSVIGAMLGRIPALPLYSRIQRGEAMLNDRRSQLYDIVIAEPGIHLSDLVRRSGLGWGAALYHLGVLEKNRVLVAHAEGGFKRYFANGAQTREELPRIVALRHEAARALFEAVQSFPGRSGRELSDALGLSPSTLARASDRLEDAGLVRRVRQGRRVLYYPAQPATSPEPAVGPASAAA